MTAHTLWTEAVFVIKLSPPPLQPVCKNTLPPHSNQHNQPFGLEIFSKRTTLCHSGRRNTWLFVLAPVADSMFGKDNIHRRGAEAQTWTNTRLHTKVTEKFPSGRNSHLGLGYTLVGLRCFLTKNRRLWLQHFCCQCESVTVAASGQTMGFHNRLTECSSKSVFHEKQNGRANP